MDWPVAVGRRTGRRDINTGSPMLCLDSAKPAEDNLRPLKGACPIRVVAM